MIVKSVGIFKAEIIGLHSRRKGLLTGREDLFFIGAKGRVPSYPINWGLVEDASEVLIASTQVGKRGLRRL